MTSPFALTSRTRAWSTVLAACATALVFAVAGTEVQAAPDCNDPYYYTAPECLPGGSTKPTPAAVELSVANRCRSRNFTLRPTFSGAPVVDSKLYRNGRKYFFDTSAPFAFKINVRKLKKGSSSRFRLVTTFTSGESVVKEFKVKRCGKPFKRR